MRVHVHERQLGTEGDCKPAECAMSRCTDGRTRVTERLARMGLEKRGSSRAKKRGQPARQPAQSTSLPPARCGRYLAAFCGQGGGAKQGHSEAGQTQRYMTCNPALLRCPPQQGQAATLSDRHCSEVLESSAPKPAAALLTVMCLSPRPLQMHHNNCTIPPQSLFKVGRSLTVTSLSPRPLQLRTMRVPSGTAGASLSRKARAWEVSRAGMMPSRRDTSWNAPSASSSAGANG